MKKALCILLCLMMIMAFAACGETPEPAADDVVDINQLQGPDLHFTTDDFPVIDGATALAPYYEAMAAIMLDMPAEEARGYVLCSKTSGAYENLFEGKADIIFCSHPGEEYTEWADNIGFEFEMVPFINGGFVFFVNKANPVDSITIEQAHDIYAGKITNWKELGGNDEPIIAYQRPDNSGSQIGLYEYIIDKEEVMEAPSEMVFSAMEGIVDAVSSYENAAGSIGYSYYYVTNMHYQDEIKLLQIDGIAPSDETIANGTYPIINPSFAIIDASTPKDSPVWDILEWITSEKGQQVARNAGYVPKMDCE